jgi:hypothetical protein
MLNSRYTRPLLGISRHTISLGVCARVFESNPSRLLRTGMRGPGDTFLSLSTSFSRFLGLLLQSRMLQQVEHI